MERNRIYLAVIIIVSLLGIAADFAKWYPDSTGYVETTRYLFGYDGGARNEQRMIRPVTMLLAGFIMPLVGDSYSFALVNAAFWIASAVLMYVFTLRLLGRKELSLFAAILFTTSMPLLRYGSAVLTDMGGYFFVLLTFYLLLDFDREMRIREIAWMGILLAIGILTREHVGVLLLLYLLFINLAGKRNIRNSILLIFIASSIPFLYYIAVGTDPFYHFLNQPDVGYDYTVGWGPLSFILSMAGAFLILPIFSVIGLKYEKNKRPYLLMLASMLPVLLIWPVMDYRFSFMASPLVMPLAASGIDRFARKLPFRKPRYLELLLVLSYAAACFLYVAIRHGLS